MSNRGACGEGCDELSAAQRALRELSSLRTILWQGKTKRKVRDLIQWVEARAAKGLGE